MSSYSWPGSSGGSSGVITFTYNGASQAVTEDVSTPANNRPLPVLLLDSSGNINTVTVSSSVLPTGGATAALQTTGNTSLSSIDGKFGSLGQKAMAGSAPVVIASDQSALPVTQSGSWNLVNISGTISLPTGASTSALQTTGNTSLASIDGKLGSLGQKAMAGSAPVVIASDQSAIPASQSGTWNITNVSGTVSLPTGASTSALQTTGNTSLSSIDGKLGSLGQKTMSGSAPVVIASDQSNLNTKAVGKTAVTLVRNDYSSVNVTTSAYVQLVASLGSAVTEIEIFDSSGQTLFLATGAAASEVNQIYIVPGGNGRIPLAIAASTRVAIKAVSATANQGEIDINFYG